MRGMKAHQRNTETFRSSVFADVRPEDIALHRRGKKMGIQRKVDTFDHLFGSSLTSKDSVTTARRIFGPPPPHPSSLKGLESGTRRCSFGPSMFPMDMNRNRDNSTSVLHRPLALNRTFETQRPSNSSAKDCPASSTEFPPLERAIRATCGRPSADIYLVPMVTETHEDLPRDIFWLGDPRAELFNSADAEPRIEQVSSYTAATRQSPDDSAGAIYWLGDPALEAPRQKSDLCRARLRPKQFSMLPTGAEAPCRIRQTRNSIL